MYVLWVIEYDFASSFHILNKTFESSGAQEITFGFITPPGVEKLSSVAKAWKSKKSKERRISFLFKSNRQNLCPHLKAAAKIEALFALLEIEKCSQNGKKLV
jgi:hypothetical protein